jgi:hypothetical protein
MKGTSFGNSEVTASSKVRPSFRTALSELSDDGVLHRKFREFPLDVIESLARKLAEDSAFKTLAQLNLASRDIREETLPALYE